MAKNKPAANEALKSQLEGGGILYLLKSLKPYFIVFIASMCGMIIEIVAARILAPSIGVSLYTWTSIIGIVLAGISIGNYLGGRLADRFPKPTTLGFILLAGGIFSLIVLPLLKVLPEAVQTLSFIPQIIILTTAMFFLPCLILGMVSPVVIKLRLQNLAQTGNVVGKIYAVSTAGGIFGTFITGFVLIQWMGTRAIILLVAVLLVCMALAFGKLWRAKTATLVCLVLLLGIGGLAIPAKVTGTDIVIESNYNTIRVSDNVQADQPVKVLELDGLVHSYISLQDPTFLAYDYLKVIADIATYTAQQNPNMRALFIGGGGYTMPKYLEKKYPQSTLEVIEIDPEVTRVDFAYLGLSPDTHIVTFNEDARQAVKKLPEGQYDMVFGDAYKNYSIPYQLTTHEFNQQVKGLLKSNGIYVANLIDKLHSGKFLRAYVNTVRQTFPYVYLIPGNTAWEDDSRATHLVVCSMQPLASTALSEASARAGFAPPVITPKDTLASWLNEQDNIFLTDDYAPVDNLLAALYLEQAHFIAAGEHNNAGVALMNQGKLKEAISKYDRAILINPDLAAAYDNRGLAYFRLNQFQRAVQDFNETIRLDSHNALPYNNRGLAYLHLDQFQRAIQDLDEAIRLDSNLAQAYNNRGLAYYYLDQFQRAVQDYSTSIRLDTNITNAYVNRALAYTRLNMDTKAQQDFDQAVKLGYDPVSLKADIEKVKKER